MLITFALKSLGKINIEQTVIKRIRELLKNEPKSEVINEDFTSDMNASTTVNAVA